MTTYGAYVYAPILSGNARADQKAVTLSVGSRPKVRWHRKTMPLACRRDARTTRVLGTSKNPVASKELLKKRSRRLKVRSGMSSSERRKPRDVRAKAMMLAVDARRSGDLAEDIRGTALRPSQPDSNVVTSLGSN